MRVSLNDYVRGETRGTRDEWLASFSFPMGKRSRGTSVRIWAPLGRPSSEVSEP